MNNDLNSREPLGPTDAQIARMRAGVHATIAADQTHTRRRRGWTIGGALGLLVVLAGGTSVAMAAGVLQAPAWFVAAPAPAPTVTHEATVAATPTTSATPAPTATPSEGSAPFTMTCDQLVPSSVVSSISPQLVLQPRGSNPAGIAETLNASKGDLTQGWYGNDLAAAGTGYFSCTWDATTSGIDVPADGAALLTLEAIPQSVADAGPEPLGFATPPSFDQANVKCGASDGYGRCTLLAAQDSVYYAVTLNINRASPDVTPTVTQQLKQVLGDALGAVTASGTRPAPLAHPSGRWTTVRDCTAIDSAITSVSPSARPTSTDAGLLWQTDSEDFLGPIAINASGFACTASNPYTTITVMPGLADVAWAPASKGMQPITIAGTTAAATAAAATADYGNGWPVTIADIDGALVMTTSPNATATRTMMAAVAASTAG